MGCNSHASSHTGCSQCTAVTPFPPATHASLKKHSLVQVQRLVGAVLRVVPRLAAHVAGVAVLERAVEQRQLPQLQLLVLVVLVVAGRAQLLHHGAGAVHLWGGHPGEGNTGDR